MLNLTDEELTEFSKWKEDFVNELKIRIETIKLVKPEDYKEDKLYSKLSELVFNLAKFTVEKGYASFPIIGIVEKERVFGAALEEWSHVIENIMGNEYADMFASKLGDLQIIFGIGI